MTYVDGFVIPIKKKKIAAYRRMAKWGLKMWKKHGALDYYECIADDLRAKKGVGLGFKKMAKIAPDETVVFSFIVYKSRAHRDAVNKAVMNDPAMEMDSKMAQECADVINPRRFAQGGFKVITQL